MTASGVFVLSHGIFSHSLADYIIFYLVKIVNIHVREPGVSLLAFEVYAFYIKSVARSFYSQLLLLWIPMRTKFPLCFLSAFFLMLFLIPFI